MHINTVLDSAIRPAEHEYWKKCCVLSGALDTKKVDLRMNLLYFLMFDSSPGYSVVCLVEIKLLAICHLRMYANYSEQAFICFFEYMIGHMIVEIRPEPLGHESLSVNLVEKVTHPIRRIGDTSMPCLTTESIEIASFHQ